MSAGNSGLRSAQVVGRAFLLPELLQLVGGCAGEPRIFRIRDDGQAVVGDFEFVPIDTVLGTAGDLVLFNSSRGVLDVGFARAEALEPTTCSRDIDADLDVRRLPVELLGDRLRQRSDGRRSVRHDLSRERAEVCVLGEHRHRTGAQSTASTNASSPWRSQDTFRYSDVLICLPVCNFRVARATHP